jgi:hypothetical protein
VHDAPVALDVLPLVRGVLGDLREGLGHREIVWLVQYVWMNAAPLQEVEQPPVKLGDTQALLERERLRLTATRDQHHPVREEVERDLERSEAVGIGNGVRG